MCGRTTHQRGTTTVTMPNPTNGPLGRHVASHCSAIWNTRFAQRIGGYSPDRRLGDDSRFVHGAVTAGNIAYVNEALYHYVRRPNSLTMARDTRPNTVARKRSGAQRRQLQAIMDTTPPDTWHTLTAPTDQVGFAADVQRVQAALP